MANQPAPSDLSAQRRRFIIRHGVLRYGLGLGLCIFIWVVAGEYGGPLEHLQTRASWLRLSFLLVLSIAEWVVGAGWLIGHGLWYLVQHPIRGGAQPDDRVAPKTRSPARDR